MPRPRLPRSGGRAGSLISLTPLIDVVFILVIFFMLASSFVDWRSIDLSVPAGAATGTAEDGALLVEVRADGLRLSGEPVTLDGLAARIAEAPDRHVLVRPAPLVGVQRVVAVLDRLAAAGAENLSLVGGGSGSGGGQP